MSLRGSIGAAVVVAVATALACASPGLSASSVNVTLTVNSSSSVDASGCATGSTGTSFGTVQPGTSAVTIADCVVTFGSTNDTSRLRAFQSDVGGMAMWRTPDGSLDGAFGSSGVVSTHVAGEDGAEDLLRAPDGSVYVAGWSTATTENITILRYTAAGVLDTTFNATGFRTTHLSGNDRGHAIERLPDGSLLVAGYTTPSTRDVALVKYTSTGALDTTFTGDGSATFDVSGDDTINDIVVQPDGAIVLVGSTGAGADTLIMRVTSAGALDSSFSGDGILVVDAGTTEAANEALLQPDGAIVTGGWSVQTTENHTLLRILGNGSLDSTFDGNGIATANAGGNDRAQGIDLDETGRIVTAGYETGTTRNFAFTRWNPNGTLDGAFGGTGIVMVGVQNEDEASDVAVLDDGTILGVGQAVYTSETSVLVKLNADGTRDAALDGNGIVSHDLGGSDGLRGVALASDGVAIAAGYQTFSTRNVGLLRLATVGVPDRVAGTTDWSAGSGMFGACLRQLSGTGSVPDWSVDGDATCTSANTDPWNAISDGAPAGSLAHITSAGTATARLRFGVRTPPSQSPGRYVAPIAFEVIAPG